jgi:hypothetical protein
MQNARWQPKEQFALQIPLQSLQLCINHWFHHRQPGNKMRHWFNKKLISSRRGCGVLWEWTFDVPRPRAQLERAPNFRKNPLEKIHKPQTEGASSQQWHHQPWDKIDPSVLFCSMRKYASSGRVRIAVKETTDYWGHQTVPLVSIHIKE